LNHRFTFSVSTRNMVDVVMDHKNRSIVGPLDGGIIDIIVGDNATDKPACLVLHDEKTREQVYTEIAGYLKENDIDGLVPWLASVDPKEAIPGELYYVKGTSINGDEIDGTYSFCSIQTHLRDYVYIQELGNINEKGNHFLIPPHYLEIFGIENFYFATCECHSMEILCDLCNGSGIMVCEQPTFASMELGRAYYRKSSKTDLYSFGVLEVVKREELSSFRFIEYLDGCHSFTAESQSIEIRGDMLVRLRGEEETKGIEKLVGMLHSKANLKSWTLDALAELFVEIYAVQSDLEARGIVHS
jgi:hypothetical protein